MINELTLIFETDVARIEKKIKHKSKWPSLEQIAKIYAEARKEIIDAEEELARIVAGEPNYD